MRNTSENGSRKSKWTAAAALLAMMVAGAIYFAPRVWNHTTKKSPVTSTGRALSPPSALHQSAITQAAVSIDPTLPASANDKLPVFSAEPKKVASAPEALTPQIAKKLPIESNDRRQADTGSGLVGEETGEDPKLRADYFYRQRAYPFAQTPAGVRHQSLQQLQAMIEQQRAIGILPEEGAVVPNSVGFPGPANWTNIGPQPVTDSTGSANFGNPTVTGRVTAIAVDPTTTNPASQIVYLGAATGGVWKSTDGGSSWNTIFDQNDSLAIGGIAIAPSDHNTIYVGTGELNFSGDSYYGAGVYRSTDGGVTWTQQCGGATVNFCGPTFSGGFQVSSQAGGFFVGEIAVNPANANIAVAAVRDGASSTLSGIYRTTDGGANWTLIPSASGAAGNSIVWNPTDNTIVYATLGLAGNNPTAYGVYKSSDRGLTFTKLSGSLPNLPTTNLGRAEIAVAPSNGSVVYVTIDNSATNSLLGMAKSTDAGVTWTFSSPTSLPALPDFCHNQCAYDMAIAVLPNDPNTLVVGGSAFTNNSSTDFRSTDGGATWVDITNGSTAARPHVDTHAMRFAATTGGFRLYTGNDGGVWFTDNPTAATVTWQPGNNANLTITQFYPGHAVNPSDENISFGGTQDNSTEKYSGILGWDAVTCGDGGWTAIDPVIPSTVYANCQDIAIRRSAFDGVAGSWVGINNELSTSGDRSLFIPPLVHDPNQSGRLYFGTFRVWQSMNYGNDWTPISPDLTSSTTNEVTSVSAAQSNNNVVYATTTDGRVWRTTNAGAGSGAAWTNLTKAPLPGRYATMVRADHTNPDIAYISYSGFSGFVDSVGHIFKTTDGGNTWTDMSGTGAGKLPNTPVNDIAVVHIGAANFDAVFIATDVGVFECSDPTSSTPCNTWSPVGTALPKVPVVGLAYREHSSTLRAVTHGRGVWVIEIPGINTTGLLLLSSITPSSRDHATGSFQMTLDGNDFGQPSGTPQILVDGVDPGITNTTLTNTTHMTATIPASVTATPGLHLITISQPGHAASPQNPTNALAFSVTGPAPALNLVSPTQVPLGNATFPLTATGANFVCAAGPTQSVVNFGSAVLTPTACSSTSLTVSVPSNLLTSAASIPVRVFSAGPGGGLSSSQSFTILGDFTETGPATPVTVTAGQTASFTITVTPGPGGFTNAITFSTSGLPTAATATFTPISVIPGAAVATTTLVVNTTARGALPPSNNPRWWTPPQFALWTFVLAALLFGLILFAGTDHRRRLLPAMFATVAFLLAIGIAGCGSHGTIVIGTPAGTSTISITATSGAIVHTTTVTLTVQ
jgi:photosystem II stability/assembly factor-like uncharacterized protein